MTDVVTNLHWSKYVVISIVVIPPVYAIYKLYTKRKRPTKKAFESGNTLATLTLM